MGRFPRIAKWCAPQRVIRLTSTHRTGTSRLFIKRAKRASFVALLSMAFCSRAFRFMAVFLLLFTAAEVLACDLVPSDDCYLSSSTSDQRQGSNAGDNCLCCCAHMMVVPPVIYTPTQTSVFFAEVVPVEQPLFRPSIVEHPPQLS